MFCCCALHIFCHLVFLKPHLLHYGKIECFYSNFPSVWEKQSWRLVLSSTSHKKRKSLPVFSQSSQHFSHCWSCLLSGRRRFAVWKLVQPTPSKLGTFIIQDNPRSTFAFHVETQVGKRESQECLCRSGRKFPRVIQDARGVPLICLFNSMRNFRLSERNRQTRQLTSCIVWYHGYFW